MSSVIDKESLIVGFYEMGVVKFGDFTLKSGQKSPVYLDLRLLVSRPGLLRRVARMMQFVSTDISYDRLAAIPLAGLPIGVSFSLIVDKPLIYPRLEAKSHGTGNKIEGIFKTGEVALVIDDVISLADSKLEAIKALETGGLKVKDVLVVVDREMGGRAALSEKGYKLHSLVTLTEILDTLLAAGRIDRIQHKSINDWLKKQPDARSAT